MNRKVQVFSMPGKVSIGQDRNKKVPHRGRKLIFFSPLSLNFVYRNKKVPHRGRKRLHKTLIVVIKTIEIKKFPIGDGNEKEADDEKVIQNL